LNYCIIENGEPGHLVDFVKATTPVVNALKNYGVHARHGKRNDLLAGYKKISGNACHIYKSRAMHHGTLLFNSNLQQLTESLKGDASKFHDKSVKSVRSEVVNISELVKGEHDIENFLNHISTFLQEKFLAMPYEFTKTDLEEIENLMKSKYNTWNWNYGYSPTYEFTKRIKSANYVFTSKLKVEKGMITEIEIKSNHPQKEKLSEIKGLIKGSKHEKREIERQLQGADEEIKQAIIESLF